MVICRRFPNLEPDMHKRILGPIVIAIEEPSPIGFRAWTVKFHGSGRSLKQQLHGHILNGDATVDNNENTEPIARQWRKI
jgi:hypothetical protein